MQVQVTTTENQVVITAAGEIDAHNCEEFGQIASKAATSHPGIPTVVDAAEVTFVDSSAISQLLTLRDLVQAGGAQLKLINVHPNVHRVLEITGLLPAFGL